MYFDGITDLAELKAEFRRLALRLHPDCGGSDEEMRELLRQYRIAGVNLSLGKFVKNFERKCQQKRGQADIGNGMATVPERVKYDYKLLCQIAQFIATYSDRAKKMSIFQVFEIVRARLDPAQEKRFQTQAFNFKKIKKFLKEAQKIFMAEGYQYQDALMLWTEAKKQFFALNPSIEVKL